MHNAFIKPYIRVWITGKFIPEYVVCSAHQWKHDYYLVILLKLERTDLLSFAISQNQINLTNTHQFLKPYLPSLPDLNTVNTAIHKQQFHKHCKC